MNNIVLDWDAIRPLNGSRANGFEELHQRAAFRTQVVRSWHHALRRRSQHDRTSWARTNRLAARWVPPARVSHPYPWDRFEAKTRGKSRVR